MSFVRMREFNRAAGCLKRNYGSVSGRLYVAGEANVKPSPIYEVGRKELAHLITVRQPKRLDVSAFEVLPVDTREELDALLLREANARGRSGMPAYTPAIQSPRVATPPRPQTPPPARVSNPPVRAPMFDGTNEAEVAAALPDTPPAEPQIQEPVESRSPATRGLQRRTAADLLGDTPPDGEQPQSDDPPAENEPPPAGAKAPAKKTPAKKRRTKRKTKSRTEKAAATKPTGQQDASPSTHEDPEASVPTDE